VIFGFSNLVLGKKRMMTPVVDDFSATGFLVYRKRICRGLLGFLLPEE
jgi:hypothetical protein